MGMIYTLLCNDGTVYVGDETKTCINNGGKKSSSGGTVDFTTSVKPTSENVKLQNAMVLQNVNVLTTEDKFYEMLGIKKTSGGWGIQSRPLGRFLVAVVLVAGYFAYKKYKK